MSSLNTIIRKRIKKEKGYSQGEKIFIKINQGTASWVMSKEEKDNGYTISSSLKQVRKEG